MAFQDRPHARGGDDDADGGELTVDATVAPLWVLLRQAEDESGGSFRDARPAGPAVRVGPAFGDEVPVPAQQSFWLDEEVPDPAVKVLVVGHGWLLGTDTSEISAGVVASASMPEV